MICENELALALYDKFPVSKGHVLVIPKRRVHIIPRYKGDVENPKGGVRNLIPNLMKYLAGFLLVLLVSKADALLTVSGGENDRQLPVI